MNLGFRLLWHVYRLYVWSRRWAHRRFSHAGLGILAGALIAGVLGPDTENNIAYQGFGFLLLLLLSSVAFGWTFRGRFAAERLLPRFGTVGCPLNYGVTIRNLGANAQRGLSLLENVADERPSFEEWLAVQMADEKQARSFRFSQRRRANPFKLAQTRNREVPALSAGQALTVQCELMPLHRGVLRFDGVALGRPDPLGLFRSLVHLALPQTVLILPRRYPVPRPALPGLMKYQPGGVAQASNVGLSQEFFALRDYRQGDPMRHIHWRTWARAGKPVVKEFEDEFFVRHALVLDTFVEHPCNEAFEEAVSIAASFACTMQTQESLLDLLFVGPESFCFTGGRGLAYAEQMLEILASVQVCNGRPFEDLQDLVLEHVNLVSGCVCVLLAWDKSRQDFVEKLKALGVPIMVLVVLERGRETRLDPGPMRDDPANFHVLSCGQIEQGLARVQ